MSIRVPYCIGDLEKGTLIFGELPMELLLIHEELSASLGFRVRASGFQGLGFRV